MNDYAAATDGPSFIDIENLGNLVEMPHVPEPEPYPKWPHLENLDRILVDRPDYLDREVQVTEKLDGFNGRFGRTKDGEPWLGTRNTVLAAGYGAVTAADPAGMQGFVGYAKVAALACERGQTVFGEWAGTGIQKRIDYGAPTFYAFFPEWWVEGLEMDCVPGEGSGRFTLDELRAFRDLPSRLAAAPREGIVITPLTPVYDAYGHVLIAKYKSAAFEERSSRMHRTYVAPDVASAQAFVDEYVTAERLRHVLMLVGGDYGHGPSAILHDPRMTGNILSRMYEDVIREGAADFAALDEANQKAVGKLLPRPTKALLEAARL